MDWFCLVIHSLITVKHKRRQQSCSADWIVFWVRVQTQWLQNHCVTMQNCIAIFSILRWSNCKVAQSVEKGLENEKPIHYISFFSLACHMAKCSGTQKQMSVKVISWGHKMNKGGGVGGEVSFLFFLPLLCETFIIINSTSCKHQMSQTSATSAVSGRPPSAPWDICIHLLSPGSHCSPSICWRWLGSCLLGRLPHTVGFRLVKFHLSLLTFWLDGHTSAVILKDDRCHVVSSSMSLPFCEHPVCRTVAVDNVFFSPPTGLLLLPFTAVSLLFYELHLWNNTEVGLVEVEVIWSLL